MRPRHLGHRDRENVEYMSSKSNHYPSTSTEVMMMMQSDRKVFGALCPNQIGQQARRAAAARQDKVLVPRSSSPVAMYVELPCVIEQAFSTIAWDDLEERASVARRENDSLGSQNESDADGHDFGNYALDFAADSPATLENSLSPAELVPFQGCVIPPLTPQRDFSPEDSLVSSFTEICNNPAAQDAALWRGIAHCQGRVLEHSQEVNNQLNETLHRKQEEFDSLQERNLHLRQLACRAKHLATVLEKLMTVSDLSVREPAVPCGDKPSLSPCKRQRLDDRCEAEADSVEDMLRDVSTRCNAVLHSAGTRTQQEPEAIRMHGSFSGLQTSICKDSGSTDGAEAGENILSFRTSVREHSTIKTQAFPHGHAFTSRTQQGGYRFRWVPNHS